MWKEVKDGHPVARAIFGRHYTYNRKREQISMFMPRNRNYSLIAGPGEKMLLLADDGLALFVWRKFRSMDNQKGVNCAVFRNEGSTAAIASDMILAAEIAAATRWPGERFYTYVNGGKVRSRNPGYCFTAKGLLILEKLPSL